jgi:hypothetical protein
MVGEGWELYIVTGGVMVGEGWELYIVTGGVMVGVISRPTRSRNKSDNIEYQYNEWLMHLLVFHSP